MLEIVSKQIERVRQDYSDIEIIPQPDHSVKVLIKDIPIPKHWGKEKTNITVILPPGYPQTMPNGFTAQLDGQNWKGFCWRPGSWNPSKENLWKWVKLIEKFFEENNP